MNILFICSMNQWRSPTAERIFQNYDLIKVKSAGTSSKARRTVSVKDIMWADSILVMESKHKQRLQGDFRSQLDHKTIHVLDIPDEYQFMDPDLIEILEEAVKPIIDDAVGKL